MTWLEVRHLRKSYGTHLAVADVSFDVAPGEILGLLGPNGAGKSTTMAMIAGLLKPDQGDVLLDGYPFDPRQLSCRREIGLAPQDLAIYPDLSAQANLEFFARLYGLRSKLLRDRVHEVLQAIGLVEQAQRPSREFSGGMKRRLNLGVALIHAPRLLILDEPTVGVDPQSRAHLLDCIRDVAGQGVAVIYASHYMEEVQSLCQRVAIVDRGKVLALERIDTLLQGLAADLHLQVATDHLNGEVSDLATVVHGHDGGLSLVIDGRRSDRTEVLQQLLQRLQSRGIPVQRIETQQSNLERLFLQLTGRGLRDAS
jgi:ABC-2 type transport system ATP-binding protein